MPSALAQPPPLPRDHTPLLAGAGALFAVFTATQMRSGTLPSLPCVFRKLSGIPCPACGSTRCLAACGRLDLGAALALNPLAIIAVGALLGWGVLALAHPRLAQQAATRLGNFLSGRRIAVIVALNWLYICWSLPR